MLQRVIDVLHNQFLLTGVFSFLITQIAKVFIHAYVYKEFDWKRIVGDGGMPSGHSATVASIATVAFLHFGGGSFEFALSLILAIIVCHDAMGVRQETGKQAVVINELIEMMKLFERIPEMELKEFVGHTPLQVYVGILIGVVNAFLGYFWYFPLLFS